MFRSTLLAVLLLLAACSAQGFEWRKEEPEVGTVIDWRLASDPELARQLLGGVPDGWLQFALAMDDH